MGEVVGSLWAACGQVVARSWARPGAHDMMQPCELVTLKEAAALTGRSESSIRDWVRAGHLDKHPPEEGDRYKRVRVDKAALLSRAKELDSERPSEPQAESPPNPGEASEGQGEAPEVQARADELEAEVQRLQARVNELEGQVAALEVLRVKLAAREEVETLLRAAKEQAEQALELERSRSIEVGKAHEGKLSALEQAIQAHMGATDAERRRADEAMERVRALSDELEVSRAELEAVRLASGRSWWQKLLTG